MAVWRVLLNLTATLLPTNGVVGIDAFGFDRSHASKHYTKRTKLTIQQLKVTLLVDTRANAIAITEDEVQTELDRLHSHGFYVEPTSAIAPAALATYRECGTLGPDADVVMPLTGHGLKT